MKSGPKPQAAIDRFMKHVKVDENGCWIWQGANNTQYGVFRVGSLSDGSRKSIYSHRFSYEHHKGPVTDGLFVCHTCDVKKCVNPEHLFLGTNSENIKDAVSKGIKIGRSSPGELNGNSKLKDKDIIEIRNAYTNFHVSAHKLSKVYGVSKMMIFAIVNRTHWKHVE